MITDDRPLKTVKYDRPHWCDPRYVSQDAFNSHTRETIDTEGLFYQDEDEANPVIFVESCHATWFEEDGRMDGDYKRSSEVRCLEVAVWYVKAGDAGGIGSFCEFHRPRVSSL